ncbi:MAG: S41 family peptidase [Candidatus Aminicenantes bacterium]|nr:S41 family peptidase [Candidatus Aminicenantes bacterium]
MRDHYCRRPRSGLTIVLSLAFVALVAAALSFAQGLKDTDRTRGRLMLRVVKKDIAKYYYDPGFRGLDLEARFAKAEEDLEQATSVGHMFGIIAQAVVDLGDSHTRFIPPGRAAHFEYGWRMRVIGETPYVIAVKPGSDAEAKGLKIGDTLLAVDGNALTRRNAGIFEYRYFLVRPVPQMRLTVQSLGGPARQIDVATKIDMDRRFKDLTEGEDYWDLLREAEGNSVDHRFLESAEQGIFVWNMPSFVESETRIKAMAAKMNKFKSVVLDLRGNSGGYVKILTLLLGCFFDHDVTIAQPVGRSKSLKPMVAKSQGERAFKGQVVVLVDSDSGSAAELFARVIQLEKRGIVIGDRSAGAVMQSRVYPRQTAGEYVLLYGISITETDLIMGDGQSLEGKGVVPDEIVLPTGADLAGRLDPALARAAQKAGGQMSPAEAGAAFPFVWAEK